MTGSGGTSATTGQPLVALDEQLVHQTPEPLAYPVHRSTYWRESYFYAIHNPAQLDDVLFVTMATYPTRGTMDSQQLGNVGGERIFGHRQREHSAGDLHTTEVDGVRITVEEPFERIRIWADPEVCAVGVDATFTARTKAYGLRRGTLRTVDAVVWDQSHLLQSGTYSGTITRNGVTRSIDDWWGVRDHSWGVRDHSRCPLWVWFQIQLPDGHLGVWHWEYENGALVYSDGCWAPTDGSDPTPVVGLEHELNWLDAEGKPAVYGQHGHDVVGLTGRLVFTLAGGKRITVDADGLFHAPYEPFHRGGLSQMTVRTDDGREGTAIYEITGARHHRYFPDAAVPAVLPA